MVIQAFESLSSFKRIIREVTMPLVVFCVRFGLCESLKYLLEHGADVNLMMNNCKRTSGMTALGMALVNNEFIHNNSIMLECIRLLLSHGARLSEIQLNGYYTSALLNHGNQNYPKVYYSIADYIRKFASDDINKALRDIAKAILERIEIIEQFAKGRQQQTLDNSNPGLAQDVIDSKILAPDTQQAITTIRTFVNG
jgi:hypothetical protein